MKRFLSAAVAAGFLCTLAAPALAQTTTIDFENVDSSNAPFAPLLTGGDYVTQNGYYAGTQEVSGITGSLVGSLMNGADAGSCLDGVCPLGNATNYIGAFNDGIVNFGKLSGEAASLLSFDAAFLATPDEPATSLSAYLAIEGDRADGTYAVAFFALGAISGDGTTSFSTYNVSDALFYKGTGTLASGDITNYFAYAYYCDPTTSSCSAFQTNKGQFALDNLVFAGSAAAGVPEATTWAMMLVGVGGIGGALRRRRATQLQTA